MNLTFITGNQNKADYLAKWLGHPVAHRPLDLDEIQSVHLQTVVEHKAHQAFALMNQPVLVEDTALELAALQGLPGPLVKWFEKPGLQTICRMLDGFDDRRATARTCYGLYDGQQIRFFEGTMDGTIAKQPAGTGGFGWDAIFINEGFHNTRGQMSNDAYAETSYRRLALQKLAEFLATTSGSTTEALPAV